MAVGLELEEHVSDMLRGKIRTILNTRELEVKKMEKEKKSLKYTDH